MGLAATLDPSGEAIAFRIREDADFGRVLAELLRVGQGRYGVPRVVAVDRSEPRTVRLPIIIDKHNLGVAPATDADAAAAELSTINRLLARPTSLYVTDSALTSGITLRTYPSPGSEGRSDDTSRVVIGDGVLLATLEIVCEPYAYGDSQTLLAVAPPTSLPAVIDLSAMGGEYETPLAFTLALASTTQVFMGLIESDYAWTGWLLDANDLTWSAGASAADANAAGGAAWKLASGAFGAASIPVTTFPRGEYELLVRARMATADGSLYTDVLGSGEAVTVDGAAYAWYKLGRIICPTARVYGAGSAAVVLTADAGAGGDLYVDRIAFLRTSAGYLEYDGPTIATLASDGEHVYVGGEVDYRYVRGSALYPLGGKLCAIVETDGLSGASFSAALALSAETRHNLWR